MEPATLVDIFWSDRDEPVLAMSQVGTKLHDHVGELIQVGPCPEVLDCFVFKHADFLWRESVHFNHF